MSSEKAMALHSSTLAWKIPWMEEPGRLQSMGSLRVGYDWSDFTCTHHKSINNVYVDYIQLDIDLMSVFRQKMKRGRVLTFMNVNRIGQYIWSIICLISEKAMALHSSTLAWKIPWMEEPGRLQSMGSRRVGHSWVTSFSLFTFMHWRRKWQPTPVFLPGKSHRQRS